MSPEANADFKVSQGVNVVTNTACPATVQIPVGIVMWKSMAEALGWPKQVSWARIAELAADADGWGKLGKPYGRFHFGHGNPISSTSGRLSVLSMIYAFANHTSQLLTAADMVDPKVISGMKQVEGSVFHVRKHRTHSRSQISQPLIWNFWHRVDLIASLFSLSFSMALVEQIC